MTKFIIFLKRKFVDMLPLKARFDRTYRHGEWAGGGNETKSGAGSRVSATAEVRKRIPILLEEIKAQKLLDIGCGDFNWMKEVNLPVEYHGIDIVESVIRENQIRYAKPDIEFSCSNAVKDRLPHGYDIVLCREVLFHLSFCDSLQMLHNIVLSGTSYLLATSDESVESNSDIASGRFRNIDLQKPPFNFPKPDRVIVDSAVSEGRVLALWKMTDVAQKISL